MYTTILIQSSLIPRLSRNANYTRVETLVSFLRKHDIIKIGLKQKGNVLHVVRPTMRSTLGVGNSTPNISTLNVIGNKTEDGGTIKINHIL